MEGKLTQKEEAKLMVHIKGCAKCARNHARIHEIVHELNQLEEVKLPQDFHQEVMKRIRKETVRNHFSKKPNKGLVLRRMAFSVGMAACGGMLFYEGAFHASKLLKLSQEQGFPLEEISLYEMDEADSSIIEEDRAKQQEGKQAVLEKSLEQQNDWPSVSNVETWITCRIVSQNYETFNQQLQAFLQDEALEFEQIEEGYIIETNACDKLMEWLKHHSEQVIGEVKKNSIEANMLIHLSIQEDYKLEK